MIWPSLIGTEYVGGPYVHCGVGVGVLVDIDGQGQTPVYAKVDGSGVIICWRCTVLLQEQTSRQIRQDSFLILLPMLRPFHHVLYLLSKTK